MIATYLSELPNGPVFSPVDATLARTILSEPAPVEGQTADSILDHFASVVAPHPLGNGHPRFYGWVNSPPAVMSIFADALAAAMNSSVAGGNHSAIWVERQVLEWFKTLLGFPHHSMGLFVSGGSAAAINALAVARHKVCVEKGFNVRVDGVQGLGAEQRTRLLVYKTVEGHGCNQKAIELLGLGSANMRIVPHDPQLRMIPAALGTMLAEDIAAGHTPLAVIASAGTVNTGAIDPISSIAGVCRDHGVWLHVDAAYGGPAILTEEYGPILGALAEADSVALDPHKWLYVPVDAGLVLVKDSQSMRDAFSLVPPYLRTDGDLQGVQGPPWLSEYGTEQTRPFRALKTWAAFRYFGIDGYRSLIEHDIALARHLAQNVRETTAFELWEAQSLSVVCFRAVPKKLNGDGVAEDALNHAVLRDIQLSGEGFLSSTVLQDRVWLRACFVNPRAETRDVDAVFDAVRRALERATAETGTPGE
jgi:glutamate/tyrosine decarboxylase-like PLP-dependent enzyme